MLPAKEFKAQNVLIMQHYVTWAYKEVGQISQLGFRLGLGIIR